MYCPDIFHWGSNLWHLLSNFCINFSTYYLELHKHKIISVYFYEVTKKTDDDVLHQNTIQVSLSNMSKLYVCGRIIQIFKIIWQTASYNKLLFLRYIYYFICGQWPPQMGHNCHGAGLIPLPQWNTLLGAGGHGGMKWVKRPDIGATVN